MAFLAQLKSLDAGINHYEDPRLQEKALSLIPASELKQRAKEVSERSFKDGQDGVDEKDCLLLEILAWFGMSRCFINELKDGAYYCYCAYVLRISRYSSFLLVMLTNTGIFLRGLKLSG